MAYEELNGCMTDDVNMLRAQYLENRCRMQMLFSNNRLSLDSLLWGSMVGCPSDSLASCLLGWS